jgi:hypothetical protein
MLIRLLEVEVCESDQSELGVVRLVLPLNRLRLQRSVQQGMLTKLLWEEQLDQLFLDLLGVGVLEVLRVDQQFLGILMQVER